MACKMSSVRLRSAPPFKTVVNKQLAGIPEKFKLDKKFKKMPKYDICLLPYCYY